MSNPATNRQGRKSTGPSIPTKKPIPRTNFEFGRNISNRNSDTLSSTNSLDYLEARHARLPSPTPAYRRQASPSPSRSELNTSGCTITLTPSERRCSCCSRLGMQLEEFKSRQSTPVRQPKSRSPSPAPVLCSIVATPSPPPSRVASPPVDPRQRLVVAPTPPPFSPHQDFPYEKDESHYFQDRDSSPTRPERFHSLPYDVDKLTSTFSPTISHPSPSKPPMYPGFTPPKPPPLEPLLPARRREHYSPSSTGTSTIDTTFNSPDKGVWVPSSPLRGTSFNRTGCPYLTRSLSPNHQDKKLSMRSNSPNKTPLKAIPVKPTPPPVNMYDHSVVLATPSSKPARKGAPNESDTISLSSTHTVPAKHGSSGIHSISSSTAHLYPGVDASRHRQQESSMSNNAVIDAGTPMKDNSMSVYTIQSTPTRQETHSTQVVIIPMPMQAPQSQPSLPSAPMQYAQYAPPPQAVPPSSQQGYVLQQPSQPFTPQPAAQNIQYVQSPQVVYANNAPVYAPQPAPVPSPSAVQYIPSGYNMTIQPPPPAPQMMQYQAMPSPYAPYPAPYPSPYPGVSGVQYSYLAAPAPPMQYMYAAPHPVDSWWVDQHRS
uniref:Uncharacterized protein n=1 Tax=Spumella elongata TaxID=89044 RepID=A0A7S3HR55_9STRA|mmetsp:Transcript_6485/g.10873  ORF Transcript_6485/g.10873 Transcript_6485/m.10873 type:complete len:599 (+) Transcript_6485:43-1839(+)